MIRKGDTVRIKPEFQDRDDESFTWIAVEDEDGGRLKVAVLGTGLAFPPTEVIRTSMLEVEAHRVADA